MARENDRLDPGVLREYWKLNKAIELWEDLMTERDRDGMIITSLMIRGPELVGSGFQAVVKAIDDNNQPFVAIRTAGSPKELALLIMSDLEGDRLKMKEEVPWAERQKGSKSG